MKRIMIMNHGFLERLAIRGTGRISRSAGRRGGFRLTIYPGRLRFTDIIKGRRSGRRDQSLFLHYGVGPDNWFRFVQFVWRLLFLMRGAISIEFYLLSMSTDGKYAFITAALGKLLGIPVTVCDYGFRNGFEQKIRSRIDSLTHRRIGGDVTLVGEYEKMPPNISFRWEALDRSCYQQFRKSRSVPQVLVYGDFRNSQVVALARRSHDIIKQKYPRTEFLLISFDSDQVEQRAEGWGDSFYLCCPDSESAVAKLFEQADTLLLLSGGGLNRFLMTRAVAASFPVITNGIEYQAESAKSTSAGTVITVVRDSYSRLAGEIIKLVDNEDYYFGKYTKQA